MTALIIIFSILLFLFLISLIKINVIAEYRDKPKVTLKILFIKINIIKEKKAKKKSTSNKPKSQTKKKNTKKKSKKKPKKNDTKKESKSTALLKKQGVSGLLDILKRLLSIAKGSLSNFFKYFIIHNFDVKITLGGDDPSDTALGYGAVCAVVYPVMGRLYTTLNIEDYTADVVCDFMEDSKTTAFAYLYGSIRIIFILKIAFGALFKLIKTYLKMKFR